MLREYLTSIEGDLDEKDAIYAALVRTVQTRKRWAELATAILWCGLWPALDRIYGRRVQHFADPDELVTAISFAFTTLVGRLDLARVHRVAATLVYSTERDVMDERWREWSEQRRAAPSDDDGAWPLELSTAPPHESELGLPGGLSFDGELEALRRWLLPICGPDTELVLAAVVLDENQRAVGERLGLSHGNARKRRERALERIRAHLSKKAVTVRRPNPRF